MANTNDESDDGLKEEELAMPGKIGRIYDDGRIIDVNSQITGGSISNIRRGIAAAHAVYNAGEAYDGERVSPSGRIMPEAGTGPGLTLSRARLRAAEIRKAFDDNSEVATPEYAGPANKPVNRFYGFLNSVRARIVESLPSVENPSASVMPMIPAPAPYASAVPARTRPIIGRSKTMTEVNLLPSEEERRFKRVMDAAAAAPEYVEPVPVLLSMPEAVSSPSLPIDRVVNKTPYKLEKKVSVGLNIAEALVYKSGCLVGRIEKKIDEVNELIIEGGCNLVEQKDRLAERLANYISDGTNRAVDYVARSADLFVTGREYVKSRKKNRKREV